MKASKKLFLLALVIMTMLPSNSFAQFDFPGYSYSPSSPLWHSIFNPALRDDLNGDGESYKIKRGQRLYDFVRLFPEADRKKLEEKLCGFFRETSINFVVITKDKDEREAKIAGAIFQDVAKDETVILIVTKEKCSLLTSDESLKWLCNEPKLRDLKVETFSVDGINRIVDVVIETIKNKKEKRWLKNFFLLAAIIYVIMRIVKTHERRKESKKSL